MTWKKGPAEGSRTHCVSGALFVSFYLILLTFYGIDDIISILRQETEALTMLMKPAEVTSLVCGRAMIQIKFIGLQSLDSLTSSLSHVVVSVSWRWELGLGVPSMGREGTSFKGQSDDGVG